MSDQIVIARRHGFDRIADCGCSWSSRNHGDRCPEHGKEGDIVQSWEERAAALEGIAKRMAAKYIETGDDAGESWQCWFCGHRWFREVGERYWDSTVGEHHAADCPVRQLAEMTGGGT